MKSRGWGGVTAEALDAIEAVCHKNSEVMLVDLLPELADIRRKAAIELNHYDERGPEVFGSPIPHGRHGEEPMGAFNDYIYRLHYMHSHSEDKSIVNFIKHAEQDGNIIFFHHQIPYPKHAKEESLHLSDNQFKKIHDYLDTQLDMEYVPLGVLISHMSNSVAHRLSNVLIRDDTSINNASIHNGLEMRLEYPRNEMYGAFHHFTFLEKCFQNLMAWKAGDPLEDFISTSAKLIYMLVHRYPFRRGTSSIAEWVIQGVGRFKGITFPDKFHEPNEDWRWRALMQPDCNEFAKWFTTTISPKVTVSTPANQKQYSDPRFFSASAAAALAADPAPEQSRSFGMQ